MWLTSVLHYFWTYYRSSLPVYCCRKCLKTHLGSFVIIRCWQLFEQHVLELDISPPTNQWQLSQCSKTLYFSPVGLKSVRDLAVCCTLHWAVFDIFNKRSNVAQRSYMRQIYRQATENPTRHMSCFFFILHLLYFGSNWLQISVIRCLQLNMMMLWI